MVPDNKEILSLGRLDKPDLKQTAMFRSNVEGVERRSAQDKENQVIAEIKSLKTTNKRMRASAKDMSGAFSQADNRGMSKSQSVRFSQVADKHVYDYSKHGGSDARLVDGTPYTSKVVKFVKM